MPSQAARDLQSRSVTRLAGAAPSAIDVIGISEFESGSGYVYYYLDGALESGNEGARRQHDSLESRRAD